VLDINGDDLTALRLLERKRRLRAIVPASASGPLYLDGIAERGREMYRLACARDLERVVAKWSGRTYQCDGRGTSWLKIKNPNYSQMDGRRELFKARRDQRRRKRAAATPELRLA
jgi:ATP-dependent DNA ligase